MSPSKNQISFVDYYRSLFSDPVLFSSFIDSLSTHSLPILRFHPKNEMRLRKLWQDHHYEWKPLDWYPYALEWPKEIPEKTVLPGYTEHLFYPMNASSLIPVLALNPQKDEIILDACAAPGGKALFISECIEENGQLMANDISPDRRNRMRQVFKDYACPNIKVTGYAAETLFKRFPNYFDKILVDAPCSSEKHVFNDEKRLSEWSHSRVKSLKQRQFALLSGLFRALKVGGKMVYSTCAITPEENELVVEKFLNRYSENIRLCPWVLNAPGSAGMAALKPVHFDLRHVRRLLPHLHNMDPMFVACFEKTNMI